MDNIETYMQEHHEEGYNTFLKVKMTEDGDFVASIVDDRGRGLLDRNGELYMTVTAATLDEAISGLDKLAAIKNTY